MAFGRSMPPEALIARFEARTGKGAPAEV